MNKPIHRQLDDALAASRVEALCVAFSGGPDSTALLHALAHTPEARRRNLRALHVDHGLQADSLQWAEHCRDFCGSLHVPLRIARVHVDETRGEGIEAAARRARRRVYAEELADGEWLALAHHRDDQIETVLLKLLRGAGPEGLGGMHDLRPFARGSLWRPLLDVPRDALRCYIAEHQLPCIQDPANDDPRFSRNILRHEIVPHIQQHWPHASTSILHAARLCRSAAKYLERETEVSLALLQREAATLDADGWLALPDALRTPVLHHWLYGHGLRSPSDAQCRELQHQAATATEDALPCIDWPGVEVRIWDGRLHATPSLPALPEHWQASWDGSPLALPDGCGSLTLTPIEGASSPVTSARFDPALNVRLRRGGEHIKPARDMHTRELRDLFQYARIPPWWRARCPLIYEHATLIAAAGLWLSARGNEIFNAYGARPNWIHPGQRTSP